MFGKDTTYVSDFTLFIRDYLDKNPEVAKGQQEGRNLLWDKQVDLTAQRAAEQDRVKLKPYAYQPD